MRYMTLDPPFEFIFTNTTLIDIHFYAGAGHIWDQSTAIGYNLSISLSL